MKNITVVMILEKSKEDQPNTKCQTSTQIGKHQISQCFHHKKKNTTHIKYATTTKNTKYNTNTTNTTSTNYTTNSKNIKYTTNTNNSTKS